jgi:hypothetical protein
MHWAIYCLGLHYYLGLRVSVTRSIGASNGVDTHLLRYTGQRPVAHELEMRNIKNSLHGLPLYLLLARIHGFTPVMLLSRLKKPRLRALLMPQLTGTL